MSFDLCIPAYNEEAIIASSIQAIQAALVSAGIDARIFVANNASTDNTAERATSIQGVSVITIAQKGKGAAVVAAARESSADIFGFIDADLSADPNDIAMLVRAIEEGVDIAIGSRFLNTTLVHRAFIRSFSSNIFNMLRRLLIGINVADSQCGLKVMNTRGRALLAKVEETGWFFDMELLARAEKAGLRVLEIPVHWEEFRFGDRPSKLKLFRDGMGAIRAMLRIRRRLHNSNI